MRKLNHEEAVRGGTAFFSANGRFIDVRNRPKKDKKTPNKGIKVTQGITEADEKRM